MRAVFITLRTARTATPEYKTNTRRQAIESRRARRAKPRMRIHRGASDRPGWFVNPAVRMRIVDQVISAQVRMVEGK